MPGTDRFFRIRSSALFAACLAGIFVSQPAFAQTTGGTGSENLGAGVEYLIYGIQTGLYRTLQIILGIGCIGSVVLATVKVLESKPEAAKSFFYTVIAFALGEVLLTALGNVGLNRPDGIDAQLLKLTLAVLQSALCIVAMITSVGVVIKVMSADEQAVRRFFTWLVVAVAGIGILNGFYEVAIKMGASI
jgi:hypothetical protein